MHSDALGGPLHVHGGENLPPRQRLGLGDVGRHHGGQGEQLLPQGGGGVAFQQAGAAGGHHHRVHHHVLGAVLPQFLGDDANEPRRGHHAHLYGVGADVLEHGVNLLAQKGRLHLQNVGDAQGVLHGQRGDGAHGVHAVYRHGFQIRLDARPAAGVASGYG